MLVVMVNRWGARRSSLMAATFPKQRLLIINLQVQHVLYFFEVNDVYFVFCRVHNFLGLSPLRFRNLDSIAQHFKICESCLRIFAYKFCFCWSQTAISLLAMCVGYDLVNQYSLFNRRCSSIITHVFCRSYMDDVNVSKFPTQPPGERQSSLHWHLECKHLLEVP